MGGISGSVERVAKRGWEQALNRRAKAIMVPI